MPKETEALMDAVRNQVEFYFSKENLQSDTYLMKLMDANMSAPLSAIMKFAKMKLLTEDEAIVRNALSTSTVVTLVDDRIKSLTKLVQRSTIILREIPSDTKEEDVRAIFDFEGCKPIHSVRSDVGDTWFVVMESEEHAKDTMLDLKLKKRTFNGQYVKCRLKSEPSSIIRSFYPSGAAVNASSSPGGNMPPYPVPFSPFPVATNFGANQSNFQGNGYNHGNNRNNGTEAAEGAPSAGSPPKTNSNNSAKNNKSQKSNNGDNHRKGKQNNSNHDSGHSHNSNASSKVGAKKIEMNASNFPSLSGGPAPAPVRAEKSTLSSNAPVFNAASYVRNVDNSIKPAEPGYKGAYVQYGYDDIINIVKNITDATLPKMTKAQTALHSAVLDNTPNLDLLHRQRTFSIDETREQLQQGKAVHKEAVLSGNVDSAVNYSSSSSKKQKQAAASSSGSTFSYATALKTVSDAPVLPPAPPKVEASKVDKKKTKKEEKPKKKEEDSDAQSVSTTEGKPANSTRENKKKKAEKSTAEVDSGSTWGGKPSFANVSSNTVFHMIYFI